MNTSTFRRLRDEYALENYYTQLPQLHHQRVQLRRKIIAVQRALAYERERLNRLKEKARNRTEISHLEDWQRELYHLLAPVNATIDNIERDIPVRRVRLGALKLHQLLTSDKTFSLDIKENEMSDKNRPKLVIKIGAIDVESNLASANVRRDIVASFLTGLGAFRDDMNGQGIETTITVGGVPLDEVDANASEVQP